VRPPRRTLVGADGARPLVVGGGACRVMAVLNVTPDSFSDGGVLVARDTGRVAVEKAVARGLTLVAEGADVLDIGGESTRPGYEPVPPDVQIERTAPVVAGLREAGCEVPISIDTTRAAVAEAALAAGADWINDTTALLEDPDLAAVAVRHGCPVVLMHRFDTTTARRHDAPHDPDVGRRIAAGLEERVESAVARGIARERIVLDPGIGFGTSVADALELHRDPTPLFASGLPLLFGTSRKSFLGRVLAGGDRSPADRLFATCASIALLARHGVELVRVHDPAPIRDVLAVATAVAALDEA
jgi:dihydropteroate synthase